MKIEIYIWHRPLMYSSKKWKASSLNFLNSEKYNRIIINHHFKEYRKNFKCNRHQLIALINKSKNIKEGHTENVAI